MNAGLETQPPVRFGYRAVTVRRGSVALRMGTRTMVVCTVLTLLAVIMAFLSLGFGDYPLSPGQVFEALGGGGESFHRMVVTEWRLPVAIASVLCGALLATGGAVFQSLTKNPLGSPDVIGFDAGSYTAVVLVVLIAGKNNYWSVALAAMVGGLLTALIVYALSYRGGTQSFRLIIVGIGVSAMLGSINSYLITRADIEDAMSVGFWNAGSLGRISWQALVPALLLACGLLVALAALAPALRQLELGDDTAVSQGVRAVTAKPLLLVLGVAATAIVTAAAGPIPFIALSAPQLAKRLTKSAGVTLGASACMGAALLAAAQLLALTSAHFFRTVPVGLITVCLGGLYLMWLLIRETRKHS
ncbi:iron chelate uptake ABC transporter family permease subunit [Leucobacter sp. UCMA 4100]|uniref:FecCD family ABC transporter permease n=1 Tax=Leucobacter sp. UCMA 4100 TaxID=2810534 RepID=UPI0022EB5319|nr:iron chelate uptake ABC transporter family permease subunit [Leucobacter sp. UCMA 4100]MDA3148191.1 iron chelate uptake ABC transporter family permease subunit [Leucobacter sp. UCMA 4100]